jgi:fumarate reductase iron-sulfur subunit
VCYAACDVVRWNRDYLGPAALNRAWTLVNDVRDRAGPERLARVAGDAGCHACHTQENCRAHCPKGLDPTRSIAGLKRRTAAALIKGRL